MDMMGGVMIFGIIMTIFLMVYAPIYQMNQDMYGVRIRPRKKLSAEDEVTKPKDSLILVAMKAIGDQAIATFPQIADERTRTLLMHANYRSAAHLSTYIGIKTTLVTVLELMIVLNGSMEILVKVAAMIGAAFVTWMMPNFFLAGRVKKRQYLIINELPTTIDLMIVCAQAGLGLLMCIDKVQKETRDTCPNLSAELEQLIQDVKVFAKSVPNALKDMGERCGVEDIGAMASALISAESKGSDISYPLRQQAIALRDKLKRRKEEEASKVPVKMVPVIMMFIMPLILCPMLGPAIITIMSAMGPMLGGGK
ncbi:MAG: type II secretion system F family protein [Candidatus Obscuribacterales bacterium]|nr:type II secretion system F family protein [Candidatus Obscuribacterales bacterium]